MYLYLCLGLTNLQRARLMDTKIGLRAWEGEKGRGEMIVPYTLYSYLVAIVYYTIATKYKLQIYNLTAWEGEKAPFEMIVVHCQRCQIQIHLWSGSAKSKYIDKTMPESTKKRHIKCIVHVIWSEADDMTVDSNNRVSILEWVSKKITICQIACL